MSESQALLQIFGAEVVPLIIELALIAGFVGALCWYFFFELLDDLAEFFTRKSRAKGWLAAQAKKRAAERGGDGAGRACETRDGDTA
jgi:hypothetical protein